MCASSELQFGGLREGGGTREAGSTVAESLVVRYQVGTHQIRRRRRAARSLTSQGRAEPLCARIETCNGRFLREKLISLTTVIFFLRRPHGAAKGQDSWGFFKDAQGFGRLDIVSPASSAQGLHHHGPPYFNFHFFCTLCGLEKLGIVDQNWLEHVCPFCC